MKFAVATSLRYALRKPLHRKLAPSPLSRFHVPRFTFMSTSALDVKIPFELSQSLMSVRINDKDDGEAFMCEEEPHMLSHEQGFGYYPITLGQHLGAGKLHIVRKLGWADYSSVWLARTLGTYPAKYVAVKILTVDATATMGNGFLDETSALTTIQKANPDHPGYKHSLRLYDVIRDRSYHGPHICLVTNVLGADIGSLRRQLPNGQRIVPVDVTKRIIKQTLLALDYLHRECGLVHTDLTPDNTLICIDQNDAAITRLLRETPSATYDPRFEPDVSPDPIITVKSQPLPNFGLRPDASNLNICLIDYSRAIPVKEGLLMQGQVQPILLRAPEVILGHPWSTPIDIWSVGCLVFDYLVGVTLFKLWESSSMSLEDVHLQRILEHIGPFPPNFLEACPRRADFFNEQGSLLRVHNLFPSSIENCLRPYKVLDEQDIPPIANFIRRCLAIDPRARPTALELLDDEWLKDA